MGGLSKKAFQIKRIGDREKLPFIFLDGGALLFKQNTFHSNAHQQQADIMTATGIARAMELMDCKAVGIAPQDLAGGVDRLKEIQDQQKLNWVSVNLVDPTNKKPVFAPLIRTKAGNTRIAILGLTDDQGHPGVTREKYTIVSWKDSLPGYIKQAQEGADMIILLSSYPEPVNREIAQTIDGIHLILQSGRAASNMAPLKIRNTLLTRVAARGKYLGMMRIHWTKTGFWGQDLTKKIRKEQNKLDRINWQIGRIEKKKPASELKNNSLYTTLLTDRKHTINAIQALQKKKDAGASDPCSFTSQFIGLKSSMPDDTEVQGIIDQTTRKVNAFNKNRKRATTALPHTSLDKLAGTQKCEECHPVQVAFWKQTSHSSAWKTLEQGNQQFNDECLVCHVTLPYYDLDRAREEQLLVQLPKEFRDVGCESCHGPAAAHIKAPESNHPLLPQEKVCLQCHTDEHDDNFVYTEKRGKIACPRG
ncbi:MAG: hypothetical protein DSY58_00625 [Desulfobulbus sp.]|nr:MAG: hypothetical protein DSY58_00625 [Desulfobulbus sp.]